MAGHGVDVSPNGTDALDRLQSEEPPEIVLADVMMPGPDGFETMRQIRELRPGLPVVLVTGQQLHPDRQKEADAVFSKPIEFDLLLPTIERLVRR